MGSRRRIALLAFGLGLGTLTACQTSSPPEPPASALDDDAITVGSFDFTESELLEEIYAQALTAAGYTVKRAPHIGPREIVAPALERGLVELVPEYAGTALSFLSLGGAIPTEDAAATHAALARTVEPRHITALDAAPAQNANTFVVTRETAEREGIRSLSDLAKVAPQLTFGGPPECPTRPLCLRGLESRYHIAFDAVLPLDAGGSRTRKALQDGFIDVALLFTTDPTLTGPQVVELQDDQGLQPAENITPLIRTEVIDRWGPDVVDVINGVSARLTTEGLRDLNARAASLPDRVRRGRLAP